MRRNNNAVEDFTQKLGNFLDKKKDSCEKKGSFQKPSPILHHARMLIATPNTNAYVKVSSVGSFVLA